MVLSLLVLLDNDFVNSTFVCCKFKSIFRHGMTPCHLLFKGGYATFILCMGSFGKGAVRRTEDWHKFYAITSERKNDLSKGERSNAIAGAVNMLSSTLKEISSKYVYCTEPVDESLTTSILRSSPT